MYFWLKFAHITFVAIWFTGLTLLPRLFVARHRNEIDAEPAYFNIAANTLFFRLTTPAAVLAVLLGMVLIAFDPQGAWLVMKLGLVMLAVLVHLYLGITLFWMGRGKHQHGAIVYQLLGWVPLALLLGIAALTAGKPSSVGDLPPPPVASAR